MIPKIKRYFAMTLQAQLVLTLASLPILVHWGLPISIMTLFGNIIFLPFLMVFIFVSSLLFFSELCHIPNSLLAAALNLITDCWRYFLSFGSPSWLYGFVHPGKAALLIGGLSIVAILFLGTKISFGKRLILLTCTLIVSVSLLQLHERFLYKKNNCYHKQFALLHHKKYGLTLVDNGYFARKKSPDKAAYFQLRPYIIKQFGSTKINRVMTTKVGVRTFQGILQLCKIFQIKKVFLPYFKQKLSKKAWYFFFTMKRYLAEHNIKFMRSRPWIMRKTIQKMNACKK